MSKNEYTREEEIEPEDIPAILGCVVLLSVCLFGLIRFWNV